MCGISEIISIDNKIIETTITNQEKIIQTIKHRGPDNTSVHIHKNSISIHTHLQITGNCSQPIRDDEFELLFNGEIYNDFENYDAEYSDTHYLVSQIKKDGIHCFKNLDGEFAIALYNFKTNKLFLATDPFGTKPLYYQLGKKYVALGSYEITVSNYGQQETINQVPANTLIQIDLNNFSIEKTSIIRPFDFSHQNILDFKRWNKAFQKSILKRTKNSTHQCFVPLSAGHDSGIFAAEMIEQKIPFHVYSNPYNEDESILEKRFKILQEHHIEYDVLEPSEKEFKEMNDFLLKNCEKFLLLNTDSEYQNFSDPDFRNIPGYIAFGIICKKAREDGNLICLSGQGGDEIYSDYFSPNTSSKMSELKGNWYNITKPWKNFHSGWNRVFLGGTERIAGLFGIESRYPLLDFDVVQEFINLDPNLKSKLYKSCITNRLIELNFPYHLKKQGFQGINPKLLI